MMQVSIQYHARIYTACYANSKNTKGFKNKKGAWEGTFYKVYNWLVGFFYQFKDVVVLI